MIEEPPILTIRSHLRRPSDAQIAAFQGLQTGFVVDALFGGGALSPDIQPVGGGRDLTCVAAGPALNLFLSSKWRFSPDWITYGNWRGEFLPRYGIALGNVQTSVDAGFTVRWGYNLPNDFANQRLDPTAYNQ